jgi:hypothetical protein
MERIAQIITRDKRELETLILSLASEKPAKPEKLDVAIRPTVRRAKRDPLAPRNYKQETALAQQSLFDNLAEYGEKHRHGEIGKLIQIAQALILCGLPYRSTDALKHIRESRNTDGSKTRVTFHALGTNEDGSPIPMPYGSDRTYLHWAVDQAIKRKDPFVPLGTGSEYMRDLGQTPSGANYKRLRDAHQRLSRLAITVERFSQQGEISAVMPIIEIASLPKSIVPGTLPFSGPAGIRFNQTFFNEITARPVPFPMEMLKILSAKPQMQDCILFLHWRSFAAGSETFITWQQLRQQMWQEDSNPHRIKERFAASLKMLRTVCADFPAKVESKGLLIVPTGSRKNLLTYGSR